MPGEAMIVNDCREFVFAPARPTQRFATGSRVMLAIQAMNPIEDSKNLQKSQTGRKRFLVLTSRLKRGTH
jgi:hypothetical protein